MSASESRSVVVLELAEEFLERYRQGERPSLKEYIDRHPELSAEIKDVFPAMALMENIALADESLAGEVTGQPSAANSTPTPQQLGDFRILREVGRRGMGIVYETEQISLGRHVALKVLPRKMFVEEQQRRRFEREAKAAARLHHTNIVPVFGVGEHEGMPYYVMQFIQGLGLDDVLDELKRLQGSGSATDGELRVRRKDVSAADAARSLLTGAFQEGERGCVSAPSAPPRDALGALTQPRSPELGALTQPRSPESSTDKLSDSFMLSSSVKLPGSDGAALGKDNKASYWESVARIGVQVADALDYAHKQGIQHRDIKPSNLLLDTRGTVWVTDFGLARADTEDHLTQTGDVVGTLRYMPPEAFEGRADKRGDFYSLGLTLYELLALKPAFEERDRRQLIKRVTTEEPARLDKLNRAIPRDLVTIVHKAIDREPRRRYQSAGELAADLQRFLDDEPIRARRQTQLERYLRWARHNPGIAILGGVLTAVLLIATAVSLLVAGRMSTLRDQALRNEVEAKQNARRAEQSEKKTANALATVAAQKAEVEDSLSGSLEYFDAALKRADSYEARKSIFALLARFDMVLSAFVEKHPQDQQLQLTLARRLAERGHKHLAQKQPAKAQDELEKSRAIFTRLLAAANNWKVLTPLEMKSDAGAKMEWQKDGSVFVHQQQPFKHDTYTLVFRTDLKGITSLRLEALADSRLPGGGPGWNSDGNFVLNELTLQAAPAKSSDKARAIALRNAWADYNQHPPFGDMNVRGAIDGNPRTGWAISPEFHKDHTAVFELAEEVGDGGASRLTVQLIQRHPNVLTKLGRFRLSFTNDRATVQAPRIRQDLQDSELVGCNVALGKAYAQQGQTNKAIAAFAQALPLAADRAGEAKIITEAAPLEGVLEKLAERATDDGRFQAELTRHYAAQGNQPLANAARIKAQAWYEAKLAKEPENGALVLELAQVLLDKSVAERRTASLTGFVRGKLVPIALLPNTSDLTRLAAAYALNGLRDKALQYFSKALQRANGYEARKPILAVAARFDEILAALVKRQPDDPQLQLALARNLARRGKQRLAEKQLAQAQAELEKSRAIFTRLFVAGNNWKILTPIEMKSDTGAKMELQKDGSVFVHRQRPPFKNDTCAFVFQSDLKGITGLCLEALADSRLPHGGPGWGDNGNFHLSELTLEAAAAKSGDKARVIALRNPWADFSEVTSETGSDVRGAIDGNPKTAWAIWPQVNKNHTALFEVAEDVGGGEAARLTIRLLHRYSGADHNLGRFRLSFTNDKATLQAMPIRQDLQDSEVADLIVALAKAHAQQGHKDEAEKLMEQAPSDGRFLTALARQLTAEGQATLADTARAKARTWFEAKLAKEPENSALAEELAQVFLDASRTREAVPILAKTSAANPKDTLLSLKVAALQAWFGQEKEYAATRQRILAFAKGTNDSGVAERTAKACSIRASTDKAELGAALAIARTGVQVRKSEWTLLALGIAEYRSGNFVAANETLLAAAEADKNSSLVTGIAAFYRAMSLFRQGKPDEARKLAIEAAVKMKPLPKDEQNPLANNAYHDDLILWLAYKEAKALLRLDAVPATKK